MWQHKSKANLPPGPPALPIIGSLHLLGTHPHHNLAAMARKYGPVMSVQLGQKLCIVANSSDAAKEFLKLQDANFCSRPRVRAAQLLMPQGQSVPPSISLIPASQSLQLCAQFWGWKHFRAPNSRLIAEPLVEIYIAQIDSFGAQLLHSDNPN